MWTTRSLSLYNYNRRNSSTLYFQSQSYSNRYSPYEDQSKRVSSLKDAWKPPPEPEDILPTLSSHPNGRISKAVLPNLSNEIVLKCYNGMVTLHEMDKILYDIQRQGKISFYMTSNGEEAVHYGTVAALNDEDQVFAQYREAGVLMYRGFSIQNIVDQCFSNIRDLGKGRQMPIHYGSKKLNYHPISSTLGTQIPHASGAGYALKLQGQKLCAIAYFGDGASSEGDFHSALNFAATLGSSTIFLCRNNRWAISTPTREQYRGDGIAARGVAYGMHTIRVDGNDFFAVYEATQEARRIAVEEGHPVLIEAMTYRIGHHSTSDDYTRYREHSEVAGWLKENNPVTRLRFWLEEQGLWDEARNNTLILEIKKSVFAAIKEASSLQKPKISEMLNDIYAETTEDLEVDKKKLFEHLKKYPKEYPIKIHAPET